MIARFFFFLAVSTIFLFSEEQIPRELNALLVRRDAEMERLEQQFQMAVTKQLTAYMKQGNLDAANSAKALLTGQPIKPNADSKDELVGSEWDFLGSQKRKLTISSFLQMVR